MMSSEPRFTKKQVILFSLLSLVVLIGLWTVLQGRKSPPRSARGSQADTADDALQAGRDALYKSTAWSSCRDALHQFNRHLDQHPEEKPPPPTGRERELLINDLGLDDEELAEIDSGTFTALDADHLDLCFLMHDAARALDVGGLPPAAQAQAAFEWVVRQVRLQEAEEDWLPPQFVLRRGWGTALERTLVFLALLDQLGMDGCMVAYAGEVQGRASLQYWVPGALVDRDLFLFDTRLGMPLPGHKGKGIATLADVRTEPVLLQQLTVDAKRPYDVKPEQLNKPEILLFCSLSAVAPRMKFLESKLPGSTKARLAKDPAALLEKFKQAPGTQGSAVRLWSRATDANDPPAMLRRFLPPDEGGTDKFYRKRRFERGLLPWGRLPPQVEELPPGVPPGLWLRIYFTELFEDVPISAALVSAQINKQIEQRKQQQQNAFERQQLDNLKVQPDVFANDMQKRLGLFFLTGAALQAHADRPSVHFLLAPNSARDHMLRGRLKEATALLVEALDQTRFQRNLPSTDPDLQRKMAEWSEQAKEAHALLQRAEEGRPGPTGAPPLAEARARVAEVWPFIAMQDFGWAQRPVPLPPWLVLLLGATAEPLDAEVTYLVALGKHEQAERGQAKAGRDHAKAAESAGTREAWMAAVEWWKRYLTTYPSARAAPAARALQAKALQALGQREAAARLLEDLSGNLSPLEKTAHLYQARQLQAQK